MHYRRPTAIAALLLTAVVSLSSCGFHYPTDKVNQIAAGANEREATVDVLGARVVATQDGYGRLIGTLVNNTDEPARLTAVEAPDGDAEVELRPVRVPGNGRVNLSQEEDPVLVTGDFTAGGYVDLTYEFDTNESVTINVPVMKRCFYHAEVEVPEPTSSPTEESDAAHTEESDAAHAEDPAYLCEHETHGAPGGH